LVHSVYDGAFVLNHLNRRHFMSRSVSALAGTAAASFLPWSVASRTAAAAWDEAPVDPAKADLIYRTRAPRNGEPRLEELVKDWITPTPQFYIRSHGANPTVVADEFKVSIEGMVDKPLVFSIPELLEKFPKSSVTCTVSCAGIRRYEFIKEKAIKGVAWQEGPIGNASGPEFVCRMCSKPRESVPTRNMSGLKAPTRLLTAKPRFRLAAQCR
jgi:DMSO/TMAO reductase YedYZ molybdopterin-dependent catalytic subunit